MSGIANAPGERKPPSVTGHLHPAIEAHLRGLAVALVALVRQELGAVAGGDSDPWVDQEASPLGRRAHCRACASGAIPGARKVQRRWLARRSAVDSFIRSAGVAPGEEDAVKAANDTRGPAAELSGEPTPEEVAEELRAAGLGFTGRSNGASSQPTLRARESVSTKRRTAPRRASQGAACRA